MRVAQHALRIGWWNVVSDRHQLGGFLSGGLVLHGGHAVENAADETLDNEALIAEKYDGIRPAPGYPACPEHTEKQTLWELLDVDRSAGIELTESMAMWPGAAVSGWYFSHPQSQYFVVGRLGRDQVADYAERKGWTLAEAERWLSSNLAYDPED